MEKHGSRPTRKQLLRLLIASLFLIFTIPSVFALDGVAVFSENEIVSGSSAFLEVSVYGADSSSVNVALQGIPEVFKEISSRKEVRSTNKNTLATVFMYEWLVSSSGSYAIGPFIITSQKEKKILPSVVLRVLPSIADRHVLLRWKIDGSRFEVGSPIEISLEGFGLESLEDLQLDCPLPENAIFKQIQNAATSDAPSYQILATWLWTPLQAGLQSLPDASLRYTIDGTPVTTHVDTVALQVIPRSSKSASSLSDAEQTPSLRAYFSVQTQQTSDDTGIAKKISQLRAQEFNSFFPFDQRKERHIFENEHGLSASYPVFSKKAWIFYAATAGLFFFVYCAILFIYRVKKEKKRYPILFLLFAVILCSFSVYYKIRSMDVYVVTKGQYLYNVPEFTSLRGEKMHEGTTVHVTSRVGSWLYVETPSRISGWLPQKDVFEYMHGVIEQ